MTNKEAIEALTSKEVCNSEIMLEALDVAIKALEQESKTIQEKQAESEKYDKAFDDGYKNGYAQARFDYEQEPKTEQFAKWVASEIFDEMWEYNKDAFAEIACRKLEKLGIVRAKGDEWELIEESEE